MIRADVPSFEELYQLRKRVDKVASEISSLGSNPLDPVPICSDILDEVAKLQKEAEEMLRQPY